ncbi:hypothetical protein BB8028_0006g01100 [Beauveria bassiana]|uniref:TLC domain-containing protein n=1 Tax=Beauveria bassiana TaxID=176275 RepID=A0A2S7YHX0_BEABA|nr:hypothetical protein BB8028_0006g01100 [Beauveria bassiana]
MKAYILGQWSIWIQQFLVINMEERRKDHWQMLTHHLVTSTLLAYCYAYHQTRVGSVILVLLDVIDLFLPLAKCLKHLGFGVICDVILADLLSPGSSHAMASTFLHAGASMFDLPRILKEACYCVSADNLQGPFTVPTSGWSHLLEPFRDPKGVVCFNNNIMYAFLSFLLFLRVMMIIWFMFVVKIDMRMFRGKVAEDVRKQQRGRRIGGRERGRR